MGYPNAQRKSTGMRWVKEPNAASAHGYVEFAEGQLLNAAVLLDKPTLSPIETRKGAPVYWDSIRTLSLATGQTVYGCADCDYAAASHLQVRPHRNAHRKVKADGDTSSVAGVVKDVRTLIRKVESVDKLTADLNKWKARALDAERDLSALRQALGKVARG